MKHGCLCVLFAALLAVASGAAAEKERVLFSEPFAGRLSAGWGWVREDPAAWHLDKGALVMRTSTGSLWLKENSTRNILLRTPPPTKDGRLAIEVRVENEPTNAFEHAGLVWYCDDDNYVILVKERVGPGTIVQLVSETQGRPKVGFAEKPYQAKAVWLRMELSGSKALGKFRATEQDAWQTLGQCDLPLPGEPRVGLLTGYAPKNAEHWSRFRQFRILQAAK